MPEQYNNLNLFEVQTRGIKEFSKVILDYFAADSTDNYQPVLSQTLSYSKEKLQWSQLQV